MELGKKLKTLRTERQLCQKVPAAYLHISVGTVSNYENGTHEPDIDTLIKLADYYNVSTDFLLGRTECRQYIDALNQPLIGTYTVADLLNLTQKLPEHGIRHLAECISFLEGYARNISVNPDDFSVSDNA